MRKIGLAITMIAAIPAIALPLLVGVAFLAMPAALIAGAAAIGNSSAMMSTIASR